MFRWATAERDLQVELLETVGVMIAREWLPCSCSTPPSAELHGGHGLEAADVSANESIASQAVHEHILRNSSIMSIHEHHLLS